MKLSDILFFSEFYSEIKDQKIPFKLAYKISKLITRADEEIKFYQKELSKLIYQYSLKDEKGKPIAKEGVGIQLAIDTKEECESKLKELEEIEIEITPMFTEEELEIFSITSTQMTKLLPFIIQ